MCNCVVRKKVSYLVEFKNTICTAKMMFMYSCMLQLE